MNRNRTAYFDKLKESFGDNLFSIISRVTNSPGNPVKWFKEEDENGKNKQ